MKTKRQLCFESLGALYIQVPESVARDVMDHVSAYVKELEEKIERLEHFKGDSE